jgi:hypothetical protein
MVVYEKLKMLFGKAAQTIFYKFFYLKLFFMFLNCFGVLILKIILKNKKFYFNIFTNKKHFGKEPLSYLPHS